MKIAEKKKIKPFFVVGNWEDPQDILCLETETKGEMYGKGKVMGLLHLRNSLWGILLPPSPGLPDILCYMAK